MGRKEGGDKEGREQREWSGRGGREGGRDLRLSFG